MEPVIPSKGCYDVTTISEYAMIWRLCYVGAVNTKHTYKYDDPTIFQICRYGIVKTFEQKIEAGLP